MKRKTPFLTLVLGSLLFAACESPPPAEAPGPDLELVRTELQALEDAYAAGENAKDVDAIMAYYAEDAQSLPQEEATVAGKDAIYQRLKANLEKDTSGNTIRFEVVDVFAAGDLAVEVGRSVITKPSGETMTGKFISVFEKRDGKYVCIRDIWNSDSDDDDEEEDDGGDD